MGDLEGYLKAGIPGQEFPVSPGPPPPPFYLTKDEKVYNNIMRAVFTCMKTCAEAQRVMYQAIIDEIPH